MKGTKANLNFRSLRERKDLGGIHSVCRCQLMGRNHWTYEV